MKTHPELEIVSRDREGEYATAGYKSASQATQITDSFHLYKNFTEAVALALTCCRSNIYKHAKVALQGEVFSKAQKALVKTRRFHSQLGDPHPIHTINVCASTGGYHATTYIYNALGLGTEKDSLGDIIAYTRDNKGNLVSERTSSDSYHYLFDGLGSVVGLMNSQENFVDSYVYEPYGVTEHQTGSQYNPWQFASGYFDSYTLYYKYGTRYYDRFGRWTQKDSMPSANPYLYANDDPVNLVDPSGRSTGPSQSCIVSFLFNFIVGIATSIGAVASAASDAAASAASDAAITFAAGAPTFATLATAATIVAVTLAIVGVATLAYGFYLAITNCSA